MHLRKILLSVLIACLALGGANAATVPVSGTVEIPGMSGPGKVYWDQYHIPHIIAETDLDAYRLQGYVHASKRFVQMDFLRRAATGRLAELLGPSVVSMDQSSRWIAFHTIAEQNWNAMPQAQKDEILAYAEGVNAWVAEVQADPSKLPFEYQNFGIPAALVAQWTPQDSMAVLCLQSVQPQLTMADDIRLLSDVLRWTGAYGPPGSGGPADLFWDLFRTSARVPVASVTNGWPASNPTARGAQTNQILQQPAQQVALPQVRQEVLDRVANNLERRDAYLKFDREVAGSNSWAVRAEMTKNGNPIHCNDPHLSLQNPSIFFMNHLNSKDNGGTLNGVGYSLPGLPSLAIGFTDNISWGFTYGSIDNTDTYIEQVTKDANGEPGSVLFNGTQVPVEKITETIRILDPQGGGTPYRTEDITVYYVPHHGYALQGSWDPDTNTLITFRNPGYEPTFEYVGLSELLRAQDVYGALDAFEFVTNGQASVVGDKDNNIMFISRYVTPIRPATALNFQSPPFLPQPGVGTHEWQGFYPMERNIQEINPAQGFLTTANQDPVGATFDGNPFPTGPDEYYIGYDFALGFRNGRIDELLRAGDGNITMEYMASIQGDHKSALGSRMWPTIEAALSDAIQNPTRGAPNPDQRLVTAYNYLNDWATLHDFEAASGVSLGQPVSQAEIDASVATTIFNAWIVRIFPLATGDELEAANFVGTFGAGTMLPYFLNEPNDWFMWDDSNTTVVETRDDLIVTAMQSAMDALPGLFGGDTNPDNWRWGLLHTTRFRSLIGESALNIPPPNQDPFPRPGDLYSVDQCGFWARSDDFSYSSGPVVRSIVEFTPDGPRAWGVIPGGQDGSPTSQYYTSDVALWVSNQYHPMFIDTRDVVANSLEAWVFQPDAAAPVAELTLEPGFTFASFPVEPMGMFSSPDLFQAANDSGVDLPYFFTYGRGGWNIATPRFPLVMDFGPCSSFLAFSPTGGTIAVSGDPAVSSCPGDLVAGWNLVSFPVTGAAYDAGSLLNAYLDEGCDVAYVATWENGQWVIYDGQALNTAFPLQNDRSYFVYARSGCSAIQ